MLWLKFLLGGLIIAFCTFLGWFAAGKYRLRKSFYTQLCSLNEKFLAELKFTRKPLLQFLTENTYSGDFAEVIARFIKSREVKLDYGYLTQEEKEEIGEYLTMLGRGDSHSQSGYFSSQTETLLEKKSTAEKEAKSRGELYLKLGLLAGLAFVILIV